MGVIYDEKIFVNVRILDPIKSVLRIQMFFLVTGK